MIIDIIDDKSGIAVDKMPSGTIFVKEDEVYMRIWPNGTSQTVVNLDTGAVYEFMGMYVPRKAHLRVEGKA